MNKELLLFLLIAFLNSSCSRLKNDHKCFWDYRLGMYEDEFYQLTNTYVQAGKLKRVPYQEPNMSGYTALVIEIPNTKVKAFIEPIFIDGRMWSFRMFAGGSVSPLNYRATNNLDYWALIHALKKEYGLPNKTISDERGYYSTIWRKPSFELDCTYAPAGKDWKGNAVKSLDFKGQVRISYSPNPELQAELDRMHYSVLKSR